MAFKKATTVSTGSSGEPSTLFAPLLEEGVYPARIVQIIDIGKQAFEPNPKIKTPKNQYKLILKMELSDEFMHDIDPENAAGTPNKEKPRWFDFEVTYTPDGYMHEKSILMKLWKATGSNEDTELEDLLGVPISVMICKYTRGSGKKKGEEANKIAAVLKMKEKESATLAPLVNKPVFFDLESPNMEVFAGLPSGSKYALKDKILANMNFTDSRLDCLIRGVPYVEKEVVAGESSEDQAPDQEDESPQAETPSATPENAAVDDPYA